MSFYADFDANEIMKALLSMEPTENVELHPEPPSKMISDALQEGAGSFFFALVWCLVNFFSLQ